MKVDGRAIYIPFEIDRDIYRLTYYVIIRKLGQKFREGKYIYGHVEITGSEFLASKKDLFQFEKRIKTTQEEMYKIFLREFPNQDEEFIFVEGEKEWRDLKLT